MSAKFPCPLSINGRHYFLRADLERHKHELAGLPFERVEAPAELIPIRQAAAEFGVSVKTITRRISESRASLVA